MIGYFEESGLAPPLAYGCREGTVSSSRHEYAIVKLFSSINCPAPGDNLVLVGYRSNIEPLGLNRMARFNETISACLLDRILRDAG